MKFGLLKNVKNTCGIRIFFIDFKNIWHYNIVPTEFNI